MKDLNITDRLTFLAESFDVFDFDVKNPESFKIKMNDLENAGWESKPITSPNTGIVLAILSEKLNKTEDKLLRISKFEKANDGDGVIKILKHVSISSDVFASIVEADSTVNKMYIQWMLQLFSRLIKNGDKQSREAAIRFVDEDLAMANNYLTLFEGNKRKKKFKDLCAVSYSLKAVEDPTDINQYKSLTQLFDAVDPFIEKSPSAVENLMNKFVSAGQALIPVRDRKFTVYIPLTTDASVVFDKFANWCTAKAGNGMFTNYSQNYKKPNGKNSDIYIIINNKFFTEETDEIYQIHFETGQIKDRKNGSNVSIFEQVINESEGLSNYFYEELMTMAKQNKKGIENNKYLDYLIQFGFADSLFEFMEVDTPTIRFMTREIPKIPDLSRFKNLEELIICNAKLVELNSSLGNLKNLELLVLTENRIKSLPKEIGQLKKLVFLNIVGNPNIEIPAEIAYLDRSKGGSLLRIGVTKEEIGEKNYQRLKELLPTTTLS